MWHLIEATMTGKILNMFPRVNRNEMRKCQTSFYCGPL